jgi:RNA polymerase sigma factor (sigma-70 family)
MYADEPRLAERYLQGDREAHATIEEWIGRAASPFRRRLAGRWDDVLQDVRLEITRLLRDGAFRGESSLKTYLWRVVAHTCLDRLRSPSRWQWTEIDALQDWEAEALLAEREPPPAMLAVPTKDLLLRVLDGVPEDCRRLWAMVLAGLSYREMSRRVGVAEGALRVRVLRCRKRAQERRTELLAGPPPVDPPTATGAAP